MAIQTKAQLRIKDHEEIREFKIKAEILDELVGLIEDKYLGSFMYVSEKEKNIPLKKAKLLFR